ncbi:KAP family NTPase [Chloroflexi bacterium TSY]|nr:KAP family NTPase [Chloroflexi bacterium TSY]
MPEQTPRTRSAYLADYQTTDDLLNFDDFRPALEEILRDAQTPRTVGLFGPWGSGKTNLLNMLHEKLDKEDPRHQIRTVWFTAWKYDRQDALWRAFILRVLFAWGQTIMLMKNFRSTAR